MPDIDSDDRRFRALFEQSPDPCLLIEGNRFVDCNQAAIRILHAGGKNEVLNTHPSALSPEIQPDGRLSSEKADEMIDLAIRNGSHRFEWMHKRIDGMEFLSEVSLTMVEAGGKAVLYTVWRDITEHKEAEKKIRQSRDLLNKIIDFLPDPTFIIDGNGAVMFWNRAVEEMTQVKAADIIGKANYEHSIPFYGERRPILIDLVFQQDEDFQRKYPYIKRNRGTLTGEAICPGVGLYLYGNASVLRNESGEVIGAIESLRNITEEKRTEQDLINARDAAEAATRAKSEFLANMSHEIRTPMNAIMGFTELLEEHITEPRHKAYLDGVRIAGKNLLRLINDILDLSKIEAGKLEIKQELVNPSRLCNEIVQIFSIKAAEKGIDLNIAIDPRLPRVLVLDETRLRQVLLNLVGNAMKFTHHGEVSLSVDAREYSDDVSKVDLIIAVRDTGIGIPPEQKDLIFEAFSQQEGQNNRTYGGTGLGLTISKRLVEMMHGSLSVESEPGQGSVFTVKLSGVQVAAIDADAPHRESNQASDVVFQGQSVLLVEDIESNRQVVHGFLESRGLEIREAMNGREAIEAARKERPDLILMDIQMPVMDGYQALALLKADDDLKAIPVVALTASVMEKDAGRIRQAFDGYIRKPVSRQELIGELARFLECEERSSDSGPDVVGDTYHAGQPIGMPVELTGRLRKEFQPRWLEIRQLMMNDEIEAFGAALQALGEEYRVGAVACFGRDLAKAAASFRIDRMNELFELFPSILESVEIAECRAG